MKLTKRILLALLVLGTYISNTVAQNVTDELMRLQNRYLNLSNYSVSMNYKAYKGHASTELADIQSGKFELGNKRMRYVLGDIEIVQNGTYTIQLDRQLQEMEVSKTPKGWSTPVFGNFNMLDSVLRKHSAIAFKMEASGTRLLTFNLQKSGEEYEKIEIRYTPNGDITSITLFYRGLASAYGVDSQYKPKVEIQYKNQSFSPGFTDEYFSEKKYFQIQDGKVIPNNSYKSYKIFDQL